MTRLPNCKCSENQADFVFALTFQIEARIALAGAFQTQKNVAAHSRSNQGRAVWFIRDFGELLSRLDERT
jgi:hypothetical protein